MTKLRKSDEEWSKLLSADEFRITRQKGTERAFTGEYWESSGKSGLYLCKCCGETLFDAATKYDSGSGWPSFFNSARNADNSLKAAATGCGATPALTDCSINSSSSVFKTADMPEKIALRGAQRNFKFSSEYVVG